MAQLVLRETFWRLINFWEITTLKWNLRSENSVPWTPLSSNFHFYLPWNQMKETNKINVRILHEWVWRRNCIRKRFYFFYFCLLLIFRIFHHYYIFPCVLFYFPSILPKKSTTRDDDNKGEDAAAVLIWQQLCLNGKKRRSGWKCTNKQFKQKCIQ